MAKNKYPMKSQAEKLAKQGRYGDSMLVHMNPAEVDVLRKTSPIGDLTIKNTYQELVSNSARF